MKANMRVKVSLSLLGKIIWTGTAHYNKLSEGAHPVATPSNTLSIKPVTAARS